MGQSVADEIWESRNELFQELVRKEFRTTVEDLDTTIMPFLKFDCFPSHFSSYCVTY
jgi:hypothetical protein